MSTAGWSTPGKAGGSCLPAIAVQHIVFHLVESLADTSRVVQRATQLIDLLRDTRFQKYQRQHGDATALDRELTLAIRRAAESTAPEAPALIASLVVLRRSYSSKARDAALVFQAAGQGKLTAAAELLTLFEADRHWHTLARLLIAWVSPADKADEAKAFADDTAKSCDAPQLQRALAWVRHAPAGVPPGLREISGGPDLRYVSAMLQRAGGAEKLEGLEPLNYEDLISGTDATGFIAERDGPDLVAFARLDPQSNTQYLERYIEIHAANRYAHYRNRSLWMLLQPILEFPDPAWVRRLVLRIVTAALTVTSVDFEEFLPLAVRGVRAHEGDLSAATDLENARQRLIHDTATLQPDEGRTDSWSHYHRRAAALAEIFAVALERPTEAADLLDLARKLPKGFAGFRAPSALTLAESTLIAAPNDRAARDAALTSATSRVAPHSGSSLLPADDGDGQLRCARDGPTSLPVTWRPSSTGFWSSRSTTNSARSIACWKSSSTARRTSTSFRHFPFLRLLVRRERSATLRRCSATTPRIWSRSTVGSGATPTRRWRRTMRSMFPIRSSSRSWRHGLRPKRSWPTGCPRRREAGSSSVSCRWRCRTPTALDTVLGRLMLSTLDRPAALPPLLRDLAISDSADAAGSAKWRADLSLR